MSSRPQRQIHVTIEEPFHGRISTRWVRKVVASALDQAVPSNQPAQVAVLVTGDDTVRGLNRDYRGVDEVTDVLSFSTDHSGHWEGEEDAPRDRLAASQKTADASPFLLPPNELPALGEVIISYPQTERTSVLVTGDDTVRGLNRDYRGVDEVTDVLSFSTDHSGHWEGEEDAPRDRLAASQKTADASPFLLPPNELPALGEVIISYPQTERQALSQTQTLGDSVSQDEAVKRELALLLVHGVLHLVGHDHLETGETAEMQSKEQAALAPIFQ